jgi:D-glycero-D-manno-heptose 1,7-bisphosphate phosphatase
LIRAVFIDRDGVINRSIIRNGRPFAPRSASEFEVLSGVEEALNLLKNAGYMTIVVTNQPDIAAGLQQEENLNSLHKDLQKDYSIDLIRVCPHKDEDCCECRKPKPGMLISLAKEFDINLSLSFMVGDRWRDVQCGQSAGCMANFFIDYGYTEKLPSKPFIKVHSLLESAIKIINNQF